MSDIKNDDIDIEEEVEVVTFIDDEGNEFEMEIVDEFEHNEKKYAVLVELVEHEHDENCDCDHEENLFIFELSQNEQNEEEFLPVEDDALLDELIKIIESRFLEEDQQ